MTLKVYFAASISGGRSQADMYLPIVTELKKHALVLTEHFADKKITASEGTHSNDEHIYNLDMDWLRSCDIVVAEVTTPSLGVGYELRYAQERNIPVLCLFQSNQGKRLSAMIKGAQYFTVKEYETIEEAIEQVKEFMEELHQ